MKNKKTIGLFSTLYIGTLFMAGNSIHEKTQVNEDLQEQVDNIKLVEDELRVKNSEQEHYIEEKEKEIKSYLNEMKLIEERKNKEINKLRKDNDYYKSENEKLKVRKAEKRTEYAYSSNSQSNRKDFVMTHYGMDCAGCSGVTKSGVKLSKNQLYYNGMRIIAVDPTVIPLGSIVQIFDGNTTYKAQALDTGGAIKGNKIDLLVESEEISYSHGKRTIGIEIIRNGWE